MGVQPLPFSIVNPAVENYLTKLFKGSDETVILEMESLAEQRHFPIVGRMAGVFLETMALSIQAKNVYEFGSGFGYSAYWFAKAVGKGGKVVCCDYNSDNTKLAERFLQRVDLWDRVDYFNEPAQDVFERQDGNFDVIFCDADKSDYPEIFQLAKTKLRKGGLYIADNVLWDGQVTSNNEDEVDDLTASIIRHNRIISEDNAFRFFINPIRDGLLVAIKL